MKIKRLISTETIQCHQTTLTLLPFNSKFRLDLNHMYAGKGTELTYCFHYTQY